MEEEDALHDMHREVTAFQVVLHDHASFVRDVMPASVACHGIDSISRDDCEVIGGFAPKFCVPCDVIVMSQTSMLRYKGDSMLYKLKGSHSLQNLFPHQTVLRALLYTSKEHEVVLGVYDSVFLAGEDIQSLPILQRHQKIMPHFSAEFPSTVQYHWIGNVLKIDQHSLQKHMQGMPFCCDQIFTLQDH